MSSAARTLELLAHFAPERPEIGLSQLCRLAQRDKATTYRHLQALEEAGFVEQNPLNKQYRLGPALLQLAQVRETTVPRKAGVDAPLERLANATGETSHVSVLSGTTVYALASVESPQHGTRAIIDIATFPLHATASGLCALSFGPPALFDLAMARLNAFTPNTPHTPQALRDVMQAVRDTGFAHANRSYEDEIHGLAVPVFDQMGHVAGAVSVASVATRFTPALAHTIRQNLVIASRDITRNWGGTLPESLEAVWSATLSHSTQMEPSS